MILYFNIDINIKVDINNNIDIKAANKKIRKTGFQNPFVILI